MSCSLNRFLYNLIINPFSSKYEQFRLASNWTQDCRVPGAGGAGRLPGAALASTSVKGLAAPSAEGVGTSTGRGS